MSPVEPSPSEEQVEDLFELLVKSVVDYGIFMLDLEGRVASWNAGAEKVNGYTAEEIIGRHFSVFYPEHDVAAGKCEMELEVAARSGRFEEEGQRLRKDGSQFWANVVITAVRDRQGKLVGYGKVTRDLTERRRAQEELRRSEERLRLLIASVKDYAIFVLDPEGHVASWNPGAERLKGYRFDEVVGRHFSLFYPEQDVLAGKCEMELEGAVRLGRFEDEGYRIRKDGSRFWANVVITPILDADGALRGFAKVTRDLSERKQHEEERLSLARAEAARRVAEANEERMQQLVNSLREARDKAEEATRLKDEFLATVSHELRTPLNAILGWSRMLLGGTLAADKAHRAVEIIVRNAVSQNQIIDDLLDVSRIITGQLRLDVGVVDINQVIAAALDVVRPAADAKNITLHVMLNPESGSLRADASRLQQVMWNLLTNAVKFTPPSGHVHVTVQRLVSSLRIVITDTGQGIAASFLPRIFDRFSQQDASHTRRTGGLGLGLAIVKHLVELHGGSVEAQSAGEGTGASFVLELPFANTRTHSMQPRLEAPADGEPRAVSTQLHGLTVLVVDDEPDARELVQQVLEASGATVLTASCSADALAFVASHKLDVIVSDIGMPGEDGHSLMRSVRALPADAGGRIPAVALTAYARAEDRRKALVSGFQNHIAKPIEPQDLVVVIANLAGRYNV